MDYAGSDPLIEMAPSKPGVFIADKGHDNDHIRQPHLIRGIQRLTPSKVNRKKPEPHDRTIYKKRYLAERMFNKLK